MSIPEIWVTDERVEDSHNLVRVDPGKYIKLLEEAVRVLQLYSAHGDRKRDVLDDLRHEAAGLPPDPAPRPRC